MANTVYGGFSPISITPGVTPINKSWGDNAQTQAAVALYGFNPQVCGPFVHSGIVCTKDGTNPKQLDITSGYAFATMADGTTGFIVVASDNTHTTSTPSTTYYLFLCNDGTWQWSTTSTGPTNSLPICQATTDGSGNISAVTDKRVLYPSPLFAGATTARVPVVIARTSTPAHVTSTADQTILTLKAPATGLYRATLNWWMGNTSNATVGGGVDWTDGSTNNVWETAFLAVTGQPLDGSHTFTKGAAYCTEPLQIYAKTGTDITVTYGDQSGAPNDWVSAIIEWIA